MSNLEDKAVEKLLNSFKELSLSNLQTEFGDMPMEILNRKLQFLSMKSHSHKLLQTELQELCSFVIERLRNTEDNAEVDKDEVFNNDIYEGQLQNLPEHEREVVQIMLRASEKNENDNTDVNYGAGVQMEGGSRHGKATFYEMTGVATEGEGINDTTAKKEKLTKGPSHPAVVALRTPQFVPGSTANVVGGYGAGLTARSQGEQSLNDWHRSGIDKANIELRWLDENAVSMADLPRWDDLFHRYFHEWRNFRSDSFKKFGQTGRNEAQIRAEVAVENYFGRVIQKWRGVSHGRSWDDRE